MRVEFVQKDHGPERLLCEAELLFDDTTPLAGMKLVGFTLWRGPGGDVFVTFPARSFGVGNERKFFDFLRATEGSNGEGLRRVKAWIVEQYRATPAA
jgi:hypothetical protein